MSEEQNVNVIVASGCCAMYEKGGKEMGFAVVPQEDISKREVFLIENNKLQKTNTQECIEKLREFGVPWQALSRVINLMNLYLRPITSTEYEGEAGLFGFGDARGRVKRTA